MTNIVLDEFLDECILGYFYKKLPYDSKEVVKTKVYEVLKFFLLTKYFRSDVPFSREIDDVWHYWILQTPQYLELMNKLPEKTFIHHSSHDYQHPDRPRGEFDIQKQISYLASYVVNFGAFTEEVIKYYPFANKVMKLKEMNLEEFNNYLLSFSREDNL